MPFSWQDRSVLVTGATGIVGSWLCEELVQRGARVVALVLDNDPSSRFFTNGASRRCSIVNGDLADVVACGRALNNHEIEVIFHLGAQTIVGAAVRDPLECFESNIRGTYNLLEAARRLRPITKAVVVASSDKAYGESATLPYREDMPLRGMHPYDVSKSCTDLLAATYANTYELNVTIARCGNIFGGGDLNWSRIVPGTIRSIVNGLRPVLRSDGTMIRDYIYVKDVVSAYLMLAELSAERHLTGEAFNFSPEKGHSVLEIVWEIARIMGVTVDPIIENRAEMEIRNQTLDSSKARQALGWTPRWTTRDGLSETVEWYRAYLAERSAEPIREPSL